jgi:hypothetical protein
LAAPPPAHSTWPEARRLLQSSFSSKRVSRTKVEHAEKLRLS